MNRIKKFLSKVLNFIATAFAYEEETYSNIIDKADRLYEGGK